MIKHYPFSQLGKANHGWLKANHHFSFAHYYNPQRMGFGTLRVVNDDWVQAGTGFSAHPHQNMEIITYIRSGEITHQDSVGNKGVTRAGEVQVMSAGSGVVHSEFNLSREPLTLFQIWINPNQMDVQPRWNAKQFPRELSHQSLPLLVSGYEEDAETALFIHQQARIFGGRLAKDAKISHEITHQAYVLASSGRFKLSVDNNEVLLHKGDGAEVTNLKNVNITALEDSEIIIIDAP